MSWIKKKAVEILINALISLLQALLNKDEKASLQQSLDLMREEENLSKWLNDKNL